jgi:hypothetical protein
VAVPLQSRTGCSYRGDKLGTNSSSTGIRPLFAGSALQKFVDEGLVGLCLLGSQAAELSEKPRSNADGNQLLGVAGQGPAHATRAAELLVSGFRSVPSEHINATVANRELPGDRK